MYVCGEMAVCMAVGAVVGGGPLLSACLLMQRARRKQAHRAHTCEPGRAEESDSAVSVGRLGLGVRVMCIEGGSGGAGAEESDAVGWGLAVS